MPRNQMSVVGRFCCRSPLPAFANSDSVAVKLVCGEADVSRVRVPPLCRVQSFRFGLSIVSAFDRDTFLKDIAAELGQHEVIGPGLLHRVISEVQRRYIATRERAKG
jgi:hypothetical protein